VGVRPKVPIPFGSGLDRVSGSMVVQATNCSDLRNVHLLPGKIEMRKGLQRQLSLAGETHILGIFTIRSSGVGALIAYSSSTYKVRLWQVTGAGDSATYIGELWSLASTDAIPRVSAADSNDKLIIAHDEQIIGRRQVTKVYDLAAGTIASLTGDLDRDGSANDIKFRKVKRWLKYIVGSGYGTDSDEDRPEIVRISKPGIPDDFEPEHWFLAGQRGDQVVELATAGDALVIRKESESYRIVGTSPLNFGILPLDELYGQAGALLSVTVGGVNYFWSLEGPRLTDGGRSVDLSLPLDLAGPDPDSDAADPDLANGFACYLPDRKDVLFVFGKWAYVLHLRDEQPRWSYREFTSAMRAAGILYEGSLVMPDAYSEIASVGSITPTGFTVTANILGTLFGGEIMELWIKPESTGTWALYGTVAVTGATAAIAATGRLQGMRHTVAVRVKLNGLTKASYVSSDPALWPAAARQANVDTTFVTPVLGGTFPAIAAGGWLRTSGTQEYMDFLFDSTCPGSDHPHVTYVVEYDSTGGGAWVALTVTQDLALRRARADVNTLGEATKSFRMRFTSTWVTGANLTQSRWVGPLPPAQTVSIVADSVVQQYDVSWSLPTEYDASGTRVFEAQVERNALNDWGATTTTGADATLADGVVGLCPSALVNVRGRARTKVTQFAVDDYSDWVVTAGATPKNC